MVVGTGMGKAVVLSYSERSDGRTAGTKIPVDHIKKSAPKAFLERSLL